MITLLQILPARPVSNISLLPCGLLAQCTSAAQHCAMHANALGMNAAAAGCACSGCFVESTRQKTKTKHKANFSKSASICIGYHKSCCALGKACPLAVILHSTCLFINFTCYPFGFTCTVCLGVRMFGIIVCLHRVHPSMAV